MDMNAVENREQERERRVRGARGSRFTDADGGNANQGDAVRDRSRDRRNCRVYISNIPYDYRWQDLKDDFRRIVGSVEYVQLFHDENGKPRGCGVVEFKDPDNVQKALDEMNRYEVNGRKLVVKEDSGEQRDQYGRIVREGGGGNGGGGGGGRDHMDNRDRGFSRRDDENISGRNNFNMMSNVFNNSSNYNLYGLSASFLESLGINGPLHNKVFVANLDYKVDSKKLKQVFKLSGKVQSVELSLDKEGNSRGFAVVEYDHPVEAVQAISMLDRQMLFDRRMTVRLDRIPDKSESIKLPEGLGGIGIGLGPNGDPLKDVARNLPNMMNQNQPQGNVSVGSSSVVHQQQSQQLSSQGGGNGNMLGNLGGVMFGNNGGGGQSTSVASNTKSLGNAAGGLNLNNLSTNNLAAVVGALSNPLISSSLNNFGLNLANSSSGLGGNAGNNDTVTSGNTGLSNNYSTGGGVGGNNYSSGYGASTGYSSVGGGNVSGGGFNAYSSGSASNAVGNNNASSALDGNDYTTGGGNNLDLYGGGGKPGGGNNTGRKTDTIIIKNLPLSCTWQTLRDKFREVGEIKFAEMRGNDLGLVRFFKERDAECAVALMDGSRLDGRAINVSYF